MRIVPASLVLVLLLTAPIALAKQTAPARESGGLLARAASNEFGVGCSLPDELIAMARVAGLDYIKVVNSATKGDVKALGRLMRFTTNPRLDGAYGEGHAAVMGELLRHVGDAKFALALGKEKAAVRAAVEEALRYDTGLSAKGLARWYPRTSAAITRNTP